MVPMKPGHSWASHGRQSKASKLWEKVKPFFQKVLKKLDRKSAIKNVILATIAASLLGLIIFLGWFAWLSRDLPDPGVLTLREVEQSTKIYDRTGEHLLYEISGDEKRTLVTLEQIPDHVQWATIVAEDRKFYEHGGIDYKGIMRAIFVNVTTLDPTDQGASTITQQLVKNAILTTEQTYTRKVKEIVLSLALERRYTKDEILQLYLNEIPYGSTNYGIESASEAYFEKPVEELSIAEGATLAALPQGPTMFLNNPDLLKARRDWIIESMYEFDYITEEEKNTALAEETPVELKLSGIQAPHFVLWVKQMLEEEYGQVMVEQGGLKVTTTLDYDKQGFAEEAVTNNIEARSEGYGFNNSGLVAMDPKTGQILAMVGSADYFNDDIDGQVNVTQRPLQPGSSFKPIVYSAAFERGWTPNSILWDVETTFSTATGGYHPRNYNLREHGPVTIRKALQGSLNIAAVKMLYLVGVDYAIDYAERLGYTTFEDRANFGLAIVLGGAEVKLVDHVGAYAVFANDGVYHEPVYVLKVEDAQGNTLEEWKEDDGERVIDSNVARMITNVLSDDGARAYAFGTGSILTLPGRPVAAKTGTTNDYNDAWTMGYTPSLVAGVWSGNTDGTEMHRGSGGSTVAAPVWNEFMRNALSGTTVEGFASPSIPQVGIPVMDGQVPSEQIVIDTASGKLATEYTPERFREEKVCGEYHSILHYINKSNPTKPLSGESKDPYYGAWEAAISEYIVRQNAELEEGEAPMEVCEIPTEYDDLHVPANFPNVSINAPGSNSNVGREFMVEVSASAPRGISKLEYRVDDTFVMQSSSRQGTMLRLPSWVGEGTHNLTVIAYDDIDNAGQDSISIRVTETSVGSGLSITNPFNNQEIEKNGDPYLIAVEYSGAQTLSSLEVRVQNLWTGATSIVGQINNPQSFNTIAWNIGDPAHYFINVIARTAGGDSLQAEPVIVKVKNPVTTPVGLDLVPGDEEEE